MWGFLWIFSPSMRECVIQVMGTLSMQWLWVTVIGSMLHLITGKQLNASGPSSKLGSTNSRWTKKEGYDRKESCCHVSNDPTEIEIKWTTPVPALFGITYIQKDLLVDPEQKGVVLSLCCFQSCVSHTGSSTRDSIGDLPFEWVA